jgi:hypothetical protein
LWSVRTLFFGLHLQPQVSPTNVRIHRMAKIEIAPTAKVRRHAVQSVVQSRRTFDEEPNERTRTFGHA